MDIIHVDHNTCLRDGICAEICPAGLINYKKNEYPQAGPLMEAECIKCGHCVAVCPTGSLDHRDMPVEKCPPINKDLLNVTTEQLEHLFRSRRSIRIFQNKPVPRDLITRLIEIARYAPTGHNRQSVEWLVIDNRDELHRLTLIGLDWMRCMLRDRPEFALFMGFANIINRWDNNQYDEVLRDTPALVITFAPKDNPVVYGDCIAALTNFDLVARSQGLGCCLNGFLYLMSTSFDPMIEALAIPKGRKAYGCLMVGYPKYRYQRLPVRNPPGITWR